MVVVSDTSAITNLYQVGLLEVLRQLFGLITIAPAVRRELYAIPGQALDIEFEDWIITKYPENQKLVFELLNDVDLGEAESIALAIETNADFLLIDEFRGRELAKYHGLKIVGVLGILLKARQADLIQEVGVKIIELRKLGFRININLVNDVLTKIGELPIDED